MISFLKRLLFVLFKDDRLTNDQTLNKDELLTSPKGRFTLEMQQDGNVVLYERTKAIWASNTAGFGHHLSLQNSGLFSIYDEMNVSVWTANSLQTAQSLVVQDDGNLVIIDSTKRVVWSTKTAKSIIRFHNYFLFFILQVEFDNLINFLFILKRKNQQ